MTDPKDKDRARTATDASLRAERQHSDAELLERSQTLAEDAEELITRARQRAAEVLALAREREDAQLARAGATRNAAEVAAERSREDVAIEQERALADRVRADEREQRRLAIIQLLALERDATDRMLASERHVSDRGTTSREDLLAMVAHDLRSMLHAALLDAAIIITTSDAADVVRSAERIQRTGAQMTLLVEDLLDYSMAESKLLSLRLEFTDVVALVSEALSIHAAVATANKVELVFEHAIDSLEAEIDPARIRRVLLNLLTNAIKFTPAGGRIAARVERRDGEVEISVTDDGAGIEPAQLESIFERYHQAQTGRAYGAGLGLYIVRVIVEGHHGRVWAESEVGGGSTFYLRLPLTRATG